MDDDSYAKRFVSYFLLFWSLAGLMGGISGFFDTLVEWRASFEPMVNLYISGRNWVLGQIYFMKIPSWVADYLLVGASLNFSGKILEKEISNKIVALAHETAIDISDIFDQSHRILKITLSNALVFTSWPIIIIIYAITPSALKRISKSPKIGKNDSLSISKAIDAFIIIRNRNLSIWLMIIGSIIAVLFLAVDFKCTIGDICPR